MVKSLYIHIPFCDCICSYCDFSKVLSNTFSKKDYINRLIEEFNSLNIIHDSLDTIYIGGGTPSCLSIDEIKPLLDILSNEFPSVKEFTIEANPESLTKEKIEFYKKKKINRISLGVESLNDDILKYLNRKHSRDKVQEVISYLKEEEFKNYNLDFIYGMKGMKISDIDDEILFIKDSGCQHVSFYSLQIEDGTILKNKNEVTLPDEELRKMYDYILMSLKDIGMNRYEVSNFSYPGYESKHNLTYWHDNEYYAIGLSSSGYVGKTRFTNTRSMTKYMHGETCKKIEMLKESDEEFEFLMLNLRLEKGFKLSEFKDRFNKDFLLSYRENIEKIKDYVYIDSSFRIKEKYLYTMDGILLDLLK